MSDNPVVQNKNLTFSQEKSKGIREVFNSDKLPHYFTEEEIAKILEAATNNKKHYLLLYLLWTTGIRISEALNIKKKNLDFYNRKVTIQWLKKRKKVQRVIPLPKDTAYMLSVFSGQLNQDDLLFDFTRQRAFQIVRKYCLKAGISKDYMSPHIFRHSYAVHFLKQRKNLPALQKILGHSDIKHTMIYLRLMDSDLQDEVDQLRF